MHTETKSPPASSKRPSRRRNGKKNARRRDEERQGTSVHTEGNCPPTSSKRPRRRRNGIKIHAGEARNSRGQRAHGGKIPAGIVETAKSEEKWEEKCTPAR
ncbi:MAG: hypothetical protein ACLR23_04070 [Clostridia bacterium]